jgi:hypothetical protein
MYERVNLHLEQQNCREPTFDSLFFQRVDKSDSENE